MPTRLVVDASVAVKWLLPEEHTDRALLIPRQIVSGDVRALVPPGFRGEVLNALYQQERRGNLSSAAADEALRQLSSSPVTVVQLPELLTLSLVLARRFKLGAVYDAHYLALAQALDVELWTADEALIRATASGFPLIRWIGDYTSVGE